MSEVNFTVWDTSICGGIRAVFEVAKRLTSRGYRVHVTALMGDHSWYSVNFPVTYVELSTLFKIIRSYNYFRRKQPINYGIFQLMEKRANAFGLNFGIDFIKPLIESTPDCDINIATWYGTAMPVWFSGKGKPFFFMQDFYEQINNACERRIFESALKLPFCYLANSTFTKEIILNLQPKAQVHVANVGVDANVFYPRGNDVNSDLKRQKVMAIIRGEYFKGDDICIKVLNRVNRKIPINAVLVGSSRNLQNLQSSIRIDFPYTLHEKVNDNQLAELYSSADLFLFTSRVEGFGLPPLEAMACGTPVVTTNCKANMDYAVSGYNCLVASPDDIQTLTDYTLKVIGDRLFSRRLIEGGIETARRFSWDRTVETFERAFERNR
jgi:glycosyltransferase involved in cell wall biosynthesis